MVRGGWPFFVRRVICLVPHVSVCTWKKKEKKKKKKKKKKKRRREKEKEKKRKQKLQNDHKTNKIHRTNCHIMIRKKKNAGLNYSAFFLRKFRISPCFGLITKFDIRARAHGSPARDPDPLSVCSLEALWSAAARLLRSLPASPPEDFLAERNSSQHV